ncbi:cyclin-dependent kinase inhibitor 1C [Pimephales promelas]|nr:cyclin-dependent kinase inhibitor 1C [Pimephales promelas]
MSKVRVSNGSPTLERVDARQADHAKPPVCRILFGSGDREELAREVEDQMRDMEKASKEKWNYDFAKNEPLAPGNYEWQEVDAKEVPEFYIRPPHHGDRESDGLPNGAHYAEEKTVDRGSGSSLPKQKTQRARDRGEPLSGYDEFARATQQVRSQNVNKTDENAYFLHQILQELYEVNRDSS